MTAAPVLFLDIDGVLNSLDCWEQLRGSRHKVDREKVDLLNEVFAATGCRLVVSSTWRKGRGDCRRILRDYGLKARFHRDWRTPEFDYGHPSYGARGNEIEAWLTRNGAPSYAIVDDDGDMLPEQAPRFVQTSFMHGLTREHADRLIALLRRPAAGSMIGQTYLERGAQVVVVTRWIARPTEDARFTRLDGTKPRSAPRNVLIRRADGSQVVRPFRGLRKTAALTPDAPAPTE